MDGNTLLGYAIGFLLAGGIVTVCVLAVRGISKIMDSGSPSDQDNDNAV